MAKMVDQQSERSLISYALDIYNTALSKGWHEGAPRTVSDYVALALTELAEAMEAHRDGHKFNELYYTVKLDNNRPPLTDPLALSGLRKITEFNVSRGDTPDPTDEEWEALVHAGIAKPEGVAVEIIDVVIRCLDTLVKEETPIERYMQLKMAYNKTRKHRHGGKLL